MRRLENSVKSGGDPAGGGIFTRRISGEVGCPTSIGTEAEAAGTMASAGTTAGEVAAI